MPLPYAAPQVEENDDGWGPSTVPEHLKDVPFAPFSKGDKLGRAADWTQQAYQKFPGAVVVCLVVVVIRQCVSLLCAREGGVVGERCTKGAAAGARDRGCSPLFSPRPSPTTI